MSLSLASFTTPELIIPTLRTHTAQAIIAELCSALARTGRIASSLEFYDAVMKREALCQSSTPPGWALPHARIKNLERLAFAVGRTPQPVGWQGSGQPVRMVFLFAVPEQQPEVYLSLISGFARFSRTPAGPQSLLTAADEHAIMDVFRSVPLHLFGTPTPGRTHATLPRRLA